MIPEELARVGGGFADESYTSQRVFRAVLEALSHPGRVVSIVHDAPPPEVGNSAAGALLLALLDADCTLWLSPTLAHSDLAPWLRFHTGCRLVDKPEHAQFAWVANITELPALSKFSVGSDAYPDQSTTCVLDVPHFGCDAEVTVSDAHWRLSGPGIQTHITLQPGLSTAQANDLALQWTENHACFPRGIDLLLAASSAIVGIPRTSRIELVAKD
jgi:alpha-D-ribose 1-methylphosphonate 5-triphosphate synthase subunit PhnH